MAIVRCPHCGKYASNAVDHCPHCHKSLDDAVPVPEDEFDPPKSAPAHSDAPLTPSNFYALSAVLIVGSVIVTLLSFFI